MQTALFFGAIFLGFLVCLIYLCVYFFTDLKLRGKEIKKVKEESGRRLYELAILKELGERIGYSLNVEEILKLISGSLHQFIDYTVVSYGVIDLEKLKINTYIEKSIDKTFLVDLKAKMLASLSAITEKTYSQNSIEESVTGAIVVDELKQEIGSLFNIPLVISGKIAGILTVAHTEKGLYKEEDMTILYKIVGQASTAVTKLQEVVTSEEEKLLKVREEFTSMIVHELRSPLDGIKKILELMISGNLTKESEGYKDYLAMAHESSSSMLLLVNDLLDLSKLQAGKFEVNKEKGNLKEVIENRMAFYKVSAEARKVSLESLIEENLPEIEFDPQAIKQILNNFLSNALKFTPSTGNVLISAFVYDPKSFPPPSMNFAKAPLFPTKKDILVKLKSLCVVVSDSGVGIPKKSLSELFQTFKQAKISPVDKEMKGTGLGLVIAKGIAEAHGGTVGVISKEEVGTSFFFTIPLN
jgi:signal transduction histidine kinase